jgi:hypothetical protein
MCCPDEPLAVSYALNEHVRRPCLVLQGLPCRVRVGCATCRILQNYVRRHARHRWVPCTDCMCKTDSTEHQCICFDALELCWGILGHVGTQHRGQAPAAAYAGTWSTRSPGVCIATNHMHRCGTQCCAKMLIHMHTVHSWSSATFGSQSCALSLRDWHHARRRHHGKLPK